MEWAQWWIHWRLINERQHEGGSFRGGDQDGNFFFFFFFFFFFSISINRRLAIKQLAASYQLVLSPSLILPKFTTLSENNPRPFFPPFFFFFWGSWFPDRHKSFPFRYALCSHLSSQWNFLLNYKDAIGLLCILFTLHDRFLRRRSLLRACFNTIQLHIQLSMISLIYFFISSSHLHTFFFFFFFFFLTLSFNL
jgi:hypothetical protein